MDAVDYCHFDVCAQRVRPLIPHAMMRGQQWSIAGFGLHVSLNFSQTFLREGARIGQLFTLKGRVLLLSNTAQKWQRRALGHPADQVGSVCCDPSFAPPISVEPPPEFVPGETPPRIRHLRCALRKSCNIHSFILDRSFRKRDIAPRRVTSRCEPFGKVAVIVQGSIGPR
jgi:hypothetical protein